MVKGLCPSNSSTINLDVLRNNSINLRVFRSVMSQNWMHMSFMTELYLRIVPTINLKVYRTIKSPETVASMFNDSCGSYSPHNIFNVLRTIMPSDERIWSACTFRFAMGTITKKQVSIHKLCNNSWGHNNLEHSRIYCGDKYLYRSHWTHLLIPGTWYWTHRFTMGTCLLKSILSTWYFWTP